MKNPNKPPSRIADYHVLPIQLPSHPALDNSATHYIYFKPHTPNVPTPESGRSLFLVNSPIDSTTQHLKHLFSSQIRLPAGKIQSIQFENSPVKSQASVTNVGKKSKKRKRAAESDISIPIASTLPSTWGTDLHPSGSNAILVFVDKVSLEAAIKAAKTIYAKNIKIAWGEGVQKGTTVTGSSRYQQHELSRFPPRDVLLKAVNNYMTEFNVRQEAAAAELARKRSVPDDDGFITVTRGGRNAAARMENAKESLEKQKEKQKGLNDFYRFQGREARKEKAARVAKRHEEEKEHVKRMAARRKNFRPE